MVIFHTNEIHFNEFIKGRSKNMPTWQWNCENLRGEQVCVTAVIVSSMCTITGPSLKDIEKILRCSDQEIRKLCQKMSKILIISSMEIRRWNAREIEPRMKVEVNELIREEIERREQARKGEEAEAGNEVEIADDGDEDGNGW
jgi:hypothetical protein